MKRKDIIHSVLYIRTDYIIQGDGYRYAGSGAVGTSTNPDNFICFGTADKTDCISNQNKYMYRIVGVFTDSSGNNHVKLIKYKKMSSDYAWNADFKTDVSWGNSDMYKGLNGDYFLTNTTYDYFQNTTWNNKIANWTWSAVNTKTKSNSGPDYYSITTKEIYLHEMNRTGKSSTVGEWTTPNAKIGLMYASDCMLSLGSNSLELINKSDYDSLSDGWMTLKNNEAIYNGSEWTLSRFGAYSSAVYDAWAVTPFGEFTYADVNYSGFTRPVFYLTSDVTSSGGSGTLEDPIILN